VNGGRALLGTLSELGVDACFANPGTSEMHTVAALDEVPELRAVLTLFEGVATGAADGYARIAGRPASTLLHLGPGLANGLANLHNARRARSPVVNLVGDHATYHHRYDTPLESDIASLARPVSGWYRSAATAEDLADDVVDAVAAAHGPPGRVATLVVPADLAWQEAPPRRSALELRPRRPVAATRIEEAARLLSGYRPAALLLGGSALGAAPLRTASSIAVSCGATLLVETLPARLEHGAGLPAPSRLSYLPELAQAQLEGLAAVVLVDTAPPASFFAYPGQSSRLLPAGCRLATLAEGGDDAALALLELAERTGAAATRPELAPPERPEAPSGALTAAAVAQAVGHLLPEHAIVVDEANTGGIFAPGATVGCPPHDWLCLTGGAIGQGMPVATGAAIAAPGRRVVSLQADGSAMYTLQALWTQAREALDITTIVYANGSYAILHYELQKAGADPSAKRASELLDLDRPDLDWVHLARGMGVPASRVETGPELVAALGKSLAEPGPALIEARLPASFG